MFETSFILFYYRGPTSYERLQGNFKPFFPWNFQSNNSFHMLSFLQKHYFETLTCLFPKNHIKCLYMYSYVFALSRDYTK